MTTISKGRFPNSTSATIRGGDSSSGGPIKLNTTKLASQLLVMFTLLMILILDGNILYQDATLEGFPDHENFGLSKEQIDMLLLNQERQLQANEDGEGSDQGGDNDEGWLVPSEERGKYKYTSGFEEDVAIPKQKGLFNIRPASRSSPKLNTKVKLRLADREYFTTVEHRGGWKNVIQNLMNIGVVVDKDIFDRTKQVEGGTPGKPLLLVDVVERWFNWEQMGQIKEPWIGLTHMALDLPSHFIPAAMLEMTLNNTDFLESLKYCKGIFALSDDHAEGISKVLTDNGHPEVKVCSAPHPIGVESNAVKYNPKKNLFGKVDDMAYVALGLQYRRLATIHQVKTQRRKYWMPGTKGDIKEKLLADLDAEGAKLDPSVLVKYVGSHDEYDELVKNNIVVVDLWAATANNAVLEAIALEIPIFVRKMPSTVQYMGKDYPLFFSTVEELESMINDKLHLESFLLSAHEYLHKMDKSMLTSASFANAIGKCLEN